MRIENWIQRVVPHDKCLHLIAGTLVFATVHPFGLPPALLTVVFIAVGKELLDHFTGGDVCGWDALATCGGGLLGALCALPTLI